MKILVTGYKGFIGAYMYRSLLEQGHEVDGYEWGDIYPTVHKYDWIMHIGAISSTTERDVDKVMRQNYDFSTALYREARYYGVNFQFSSSASVYGLESNFKEDSPVDPHTPYAWSKYMMERYIENHSPTQSWAQCFRYFNVYGPDGEEHKGDQASPFYKFRKQAEVDGYVKVFEGSETYLRDFIQVDEVVKIQQQFLDISANGIYNVGTGKTQSFLDVAKKYTSKIVEVPMPQVLQSNYQKFTCADMSKTTEMLQKCHISTPVLT
jgi:ADP-L-glycero-D-manno-heptose 6-epimerase